MGAEDNEDRTPVEHDASFGAGSAYVDQVRAYDSAQQDHTGYI